MNRGERIWRELRNPDTETIAVSEWLLLYALKEKPVCVDEIQERMKKFWEEIRQKKTDFCFVWPSSNDGHKATNLGLEKELLRFEKIGLAFIKHWQDDEAFWSVTERGGKTLQDWWPAVSENLMGIITI